MGTGFSWGSGVTSAWATGSQASQVRLAGHTHATAWLGHITTLVASSRHHHYSATPSRAISPYFHAIMPSSLPPPHHALLLALFSLMPPAPLFFTILNNAWGLSHHNARLLPSRLPSLGHHQHRSPGLAASTPKPGACLPGLGQQGAQSLLNNTGVNCTIIIGVTQ